MEKARDFSHYKWKYGTDFPKKKTTPKKNKKSSGRGKLVAKKITDKRGHIKKVWVNPYGDHLKHNYSRGQEYQDKDGNKIKIIGINKKAFIVSAEFKKKGGRKTENKKYHIKYLDGIIDKKLK